MMVNKFLPLLWDYPDLPTHQQHKIDMYFEGLKEDAVCGDDFAHYAAFVCDIVCHRKGADVTVQEMDAILCSYDYPDDYSDRLDRELSEMLCSDSKLRTEPDEPQWVQLTIWDIIDDEIPF